MLGDCGVGKTTILNNFLDIIAKTETTIGVQHHSFTRNNIKFSIWDTAGQEKYRSIVSSHYKRAKAAILVYDCSNEQSLLHIDKWIEELVFQAGANNKTDLQSFDMNEHVQKLTEQYDIAYQIQTNHQDPEFKDKMNQLLDQISMIDNHNQVQVMQFAYQEENQYTENKQLSPIEVKANNASQEQKSCEC
ncbi:unnamed protein product [Paramecium pentaurelia]|uniref:Uncharacterized protein n=1 Tax=Paramecium pentaurelia TaxID=43138 RepID=A0A8S1WYK8_9CILI|nr:unnamed protein product [Paramecium pentaurelia]